MTKERLRAIIGENIRSERVARNMSIDELAEMLELTSGFIGLIERGQRGATPLTIIKLTQIFEISFDSLFYPKDSSGLNFSEDTGTATEPLRKKVASLIVGLGEEELTFLVGVVKHLRIMSNKKNGLETDIDEDDDE